MRTFDIRSAYLMATLDKPLLLRSPHGMGASQTWECPRAMFGAQESGRVWYEHFKRSLRRLGFKPTSEDQYVFTRANKRGQLTILGIWVDDGCLITPTVLEGEAFIKELEAEYEISRSNTDGNGMFVGCDLVINRDEGWVQVSVEDVLNKFVSRMGFAETPKPCRNPLGTHVVTPDMPLHMMRGSERVKLNGFTPTEILQSGCGSGTHAARFGRPDLSAPFAILSQMSSCATDAHVQVLLDMARYIYGTRHYRYVIKPVKRDGPALVEVHCDASYMSALGHRGGYAIRVNGALVDWRSWKLPYSTGSSMHAEALAAQEALQEGQNVSRMLKCLGVEVDEVVVMWTDNDPLAFAVKNPVSASGKSRNFAHVMSGMREAHDLGCLELNFVPGKYNIADMFTKSLSGTPHQLAVAALGAIRGVGVAPTT